MGWSDRGLARCQNFDAQVAPLPTSVGDHRRQGSPSKDVQFYYELGKLPCDQGGSVAGSASASLVDERGLKAAMVGDDLCSEAEFSLAEDGRRLDLLAGTAGLAQDFFHGSQQLVAAKGFCQRGHRLEPRVPVQLLRRQVSRRQNNGESHVCRTHLLDQLNARNPRHPVVGDKKVVLIVLKRFPGGGSIFGGFRLIAGTTEHSGARPADEHIVIDHQNATGRARLACLLWGR